MKPDSETNLPGSGVSWGRVLRVLLGALFASTCFGVWYATTHRPELQLGFPGARHDSIYVAFLASGITGLVAISGLWLWRRWGVVLYGCAAVASLGLDVLAEAPVLHQVTVLVSTIAVYWLVYLNRERFRA